MEHREITTVGDPKAVSNLFVLLVDFKSGFPVVEPVGLSQRDALSVNPSHSPANRTAVDIVKSAFPAKQ